MEIVAIMLLGAILNGLLASSRGRSVPGWALFGALCPLISLLALVLIKDLKAAFSTTARLAEAEHQRRLAELRAERATAESSKTCPRCAETIKLAAKVCRYCGHELEAGGPGAGGYDAFAPATTAGERAARARAPFRSLNSA